jgi:hypothetical protein
VVTATEGPDVLDARRAPRVPIRLAVTLRHRRAAWATETEDVGPRGCQLVSLHALPPGSDVVLAVSCPPLDRAIAATGRVAWSRPEAPARLGISFEVPVAQRGWFEDLLARDPRAGRAAVRAPLRLRRDTPLHLGEPPGTVLDFSEDERAVLLGIGPGRTAGELAEVLAPRFHRARGALFSLIARRLVRLQPGLPAAAERWRAVLSPPPRGAALRGPPRPREAQRLYDEGIMHLGAGRVELALARFREALAVVPDDTGIATTLARLERWS